MSNTLQISTEEEALVKTILTTNLPQDCKIWVFGSRAAGNTQAKPFSDLDLAIELKGRQKLDLTMLGKLDVLFEESDLPWKVDIVDYNNITDTFRKIIDQEKCQFI